MPHVPQEIIAAILDQFVGPDHDESWKTCALVSTSFRPYSQKLLFSSITIHAEDPSLSRLHAVLESNPHLGMHVQKLNLSIAPRNLSGILETIIVDTLARFPRVTGCIWSIWGQGYLPPFQLPSQETFRTRLYQFLRLPSLVKVAIHGAEPALVQFFASCEQLRSLAVNVTSDYYEEPGIFPKAASISATRLTPASGQLEALFIHQNCIPTLIHSFTSQSSRLHVSRLRKLALIGSFGSGEEGSCKACQQLMDLCAESLEELAVGKDVTLPLSGPH